MEVKVSYTITEVLNREVLEEIAEQWDNNLDEMSGWEILEMVKYHLEMPSSIYPDKDVEVKEVKFNYTMLDRKEIIEKAWNIKQHHYDKGEGILKKDLECWLNNYSLLSDDEILEETIEENAEGDDYSFLLGIFQQAVWDGEYQPSNYKSFWKDTMY